MGIYTGFMNARSYGPQSLYVHSLTNAMIHGWRIYDPSYSLNRDYEVYEKLRRDTNIQHATTYRKHLVAGREWNVEPADDQDINKRAAAIIEDLIRRIPGFAAVRFNLAEAVIRGSDWEYMGGQVMTLNIGDGQYRRWWIPTRIQNMNRLRVAGAPRQDKNGNVFVQKKVWSVEKKEWFDLEHPEWYIKHVYDDVEESLTFGRGLIDALYFPWWAKVILWNELLGAAERWGRGFLIAKIDGTLPAAKTKTNALLRTKFVDELQKHMSRHVLAIDKRHDVDVKYPSGEGRQLLMDSIAYCDTEIRRLIIGSNVTGSDEKGGYARDKIQENSTEALVQYDREMLSETLTRDVIGLLWNVNSVPLKQLGLGAAQMPKFGIIQQKVLDPIKEAQIANILTQFMPLSQKQILEKTGYAAAEPGEQVVGGQPRGGPGGFGGIGGQDPMQQLQAELTRAAKGGGLE